MLVARMTRRAGAGWRAASCASASSEPCSSRTSVPATARAGSSSARRISGAPGRKQRILPRRRGSSAATAASIEAPGRVLDGQRMRVAGTATIGQSSRKADTRRRVERRRHHHEAQVVARAPRLPHQREPEVGVDAALVKLVERRRCGSRASSGSCCRRAVRMPSVATSSRVSRANRRSNRMCHPTSRPTVQPCSSAMRRAIARAATRRGCSRITGRRRRAPAARASSCRHQAPRRRRPRALPAAPHGSPQYACRLAAIPASPRPAYPNPIEPAATHADAVETQPKPAARTRPAEDLSETCRDPPERGVPSCYSSRSRQGHPTRDCRLQLQTAVAHPDSDRIPRLESANVRSGRLTTSEPRNLDPVRHTAGRECGCPPPSSARNSDDVCRRLRFGLPELEEKSTSKDAAGIVRLGVPMREIALSGGEPPLRVYDTSGPRDVDVRQGLPLSRRDWVMARGEVDGGSAQFVQTTWAREMPPAIAGRTRLALKARPGRGVTQLALRARAASSRRRWSSSRCAKGLTPSSCAARSRAAAPSSRPTSTTPSSSR